MPLDEITPLSRATPHDYGALRRALFFAPCAAIYAAAMLPRLLLMLPLRCLSLDAADILMLPCRAAAMHGAPLPLVAADAMLDMLCCYDGDAHAIIF